MPSNVIPAFFPSTLTNMHVAHGSIYPSYSKPLIFKLKWSSFVLKRPIAPAVFTPRSRSWMALGSTWRRRVLVGGLDVAREGGTVRGYTPE